MTIYSDLLDAFEANARAIDKKVDKANAEGAAAKALFAYKAEADADGKKISTTYLKKADFNTYKTETNARLDDLETASADHADQLAEHEQRLTNVETNYLKKSEASTTYALLKHYPTLTGDYASKTIIEYITDEDGKQNEEIAKRALTAYYPNLTGSYANKTIINYIGDLHQEQEAHLATLDSTTEDHESRLTTVEDGLAGAKQTITSNTGRITALETHLENDYYTAEEIDSTIYKKTECDRTFAQKSYYPNLTGEFARKTIIDYVDENLGAVTSELHDYYLTSSETRNLVSNAIDEYDRTTVASLDSRVSSLEEIAISDADGDLRYAKAQYYPDSIGMSILQYLAQNYVNINSMDDNTYDFVTSDEVADTLTNYMNRTELANTYITKTNAVEVFLPREDFEAVLDGAGINPAYFVAKSVYEAEKLTWAKKTDVDSAIANLGSTYATKTELSEQLATKANATALNALQTQYLEDRTNVLATKSEVQALRSDTASTISGINGRLDGFATTEALTQAEARLVPLTDYNEALSAIDERISALASSKLDLTTWDATIGSFATKTYVDDAIAGIVVGDGLVTQQDFNDFVDQYYADKATFLTSEDLDSRIEEVDARINEITEDFITASDLTARLENYVTADALNGFITAEDIPQNVSAFTNDAGYITAGDLITYAQMTDLPTALSDLSDDIGIVTSEELASDLDDIRATIQTQMDGVQSTYVRIAGNRGNLGGYGVANTGELADGETLTLSTTSRDTVIRSTAGNITLTFIPSEEATASATKVIALYATDTTTLTITGAVWVDDGAAPTWGTAGSSLIIVASFVNSAVYLNVFHNSEA